ncbi:MAG TPA: DMT family transporter [Bacteroidales bacterium]|nr:DMT family transporter [Bacteroidales bacterium]HRZ20546.1 DMT family transporter [Bacteroidales bacterium]
MTKTALSGQQKATLLALVAVLCWSTIGSAFKLTLRHIDFMNILLYASFFSLVVFFAILALRGRLSLLIQVTRKDILHSALLGLLNPFLFYVTVLKAYDILLAQEAVVLNYVWPITLTLLSIPMLKQKIGWKSILAILISFLGVIIIAVKGNFSSFHFTSTDGVILALVCTVFWSLFFIFNMKDAREEVSKMFFNFLFGFAYTLAAVLIFSEIQLPSVKAILGVTYIGLFEMGITFIIWLKALKLSATTAKVANLIFISPFLSLIWVSIAVGEQIMGYTIAGLIFIVAGIVLQRLVR